MLPQTVEIVLGLALGVRLIPPGWHHCFVEAVGYGMPFLCEARFKKMLLHHGPPKFKPGSALSCQACKFAAIGPLRDGTLSACFSHNST